MKTSLNATQKRVLSAMQIAFIMIDLMKQYNRRTFKSTEIFTNICKSHGLTNASEQSKLKRSLIDIGFFEAENNQSIKLTKLTKKEMSIEDLLLIVSQVFSNRSKTHTERTYKSIEKRKKIEADTDKEIAVIIEARALLDKREAEIRGRIKG